MRQSAYFRFAACDACVCLHSRIPRVFGYSLRRKREPTDKPTPKPTGKPTAAPTDAASSDAASSTAPATDTAATDAAYTDAPATDAVPTDTSAASTSPNRPSFEPDATAEIETADAVSPRESASAQGSDRTKSGSHVFAVVIAAAAVCLLGTAAYFVIKKRNRRQ